MLLLLLKLLLKFQVRAWYFPVPFTIINIAKFDCVIYVALVALKFQVPFTFFSIAKFCLHYSCCFLISIFRGWLRSFRLHLQLLLYSRFANFVLVIHVVSQSQVSRDGLIISGSVYNYYYSVVFHVLLFLLVLLLNLKFQVMAW